MATLAFHAFREYVRIYSIFHITEDGIYKENNVPEDYSGSGDLKVEVVHEIVFTDSAGRLDHRYYDIPDAMDNTGEKGGGYELDGDPLTDHKWYPNQGVGGSSTVRTKLYRRESTKLSSTVKQKAAFMYTKYQEQIAEESA